MFIKLCFFSSILTVWEWMFFFSWFSHWNHFLVNWYCLHSTGSWFFLKRFSCPEIPSSQACFYSKSVLLFTFHANIVDSPSRWDTIAIQLSIWRRSGEWCNLSCALQRRSKDSLWKHQRFDGSTSIRKLFVPLLHKHTPRNWCKL